MSRSWGEIVEDEIAEETNRNNLIIFDMMNFARRVRSNTPSVESFFEQLCTSIESFIKSYSARTVVLLSDKGMSTFRQELCPEYKANRAKERERKTEAEQRADKEYFLKMRDAINMCADKYPLFVFPGVEADDMAAVIVNYAESLGTYDNIFLITTDKDWDQLLSTTCHRFSFLTRKLYKLEDLYENSGVDTIDQFISLKALQGDRGDYISGVDGVGPKRGYAVLREYGDIFNLIDSIPIAGNQQFIKNINESKELLLRNIQLVDLLSFSTDAIEHAGYWEEFSQLMIKVIK